MDRSELKLWILASVDRQTHREKQSHIQVVYENTSKIVVFADSNNHWRRKRGGGGGGHVHPLFIGRGGGQWYVCAPHF